MSHELSSSSFGKDVPYCKLLVYGILFYTEIPEILKPLAEKTRHVKLHSFAELLFLLTSAHAVMC